MKQVDIPALVHVCLSSGMTQTVRCAYDWKSRCKRVGRLCRQIRTIVDLRRDA